MTKDLLPNKFRYQSTNDRNHSAIRNSVLVWSLVIGHCCFAVTGCGPRLQPVRGKVSLADGKPAAGSQVVFEGEQEGAKISPRGDVQEDGSYSLSTFKPGDGVPPGKYRVRVNPPPMVNAEGPYISPFNAKYNDFQNSGLEFEVKAGQKNEFPIQLTK
jgi:hypothetical protein